MACQTPKYSSMQIETGVHGGLSFLCAWPCCCRLSEEANQRIFCNKCHPYYSHSKSHFQNCFSIKCGNWCVQPCLLHLACMTGPSELKAAKEVIIKLNIYSRVNVFSSSRLCISVDNKHYIWWFWMFYFSFFYLRYGKPILQFVNRSFRGSFFQGGLTAWT